MTLREQIMGKSEDSDFEVGKREVHVMTRLSEDIVKAIDALVTLNVFKSRSEAVAAYVENAILNNPDLYGRMINEAEKISKVTDKATESVLQSFQEK